MIRRKFWLNKLVHIKLNKNRNSMKKGAGFSKITIKKNNEKINMEKFFQLKVRSSIEMGFQMGKAFNCFKK